MKSLEFLEGNIPHGNARYLQSLHPAAALRRGRSGGMALLSPTARYRAPPAHHMGFLSPTRFGSTNSFEALVVASLIPLRNVVRALPPSYRQRNYMPQALF
jgi:hypothetical protein